MSRHFDDFIAEVRARLEKGRVTYVDRSFSAEPETLIEELKQETLDLAGWGFILWHRLDAMLAAMAAAKATKTGCSELGRRVEAGQARHGHQEDRNPGARPCSQGGP